MSSVGTHVEVDVFTQSVTFVVNSLFMAFIRIAAGRNLNVGYLTDRHEVIESGVWLWLAERTLLSAYLEVFRPGAGEALERWDFEFSYASRAMSEAQLPDVGELAELCQRLARLPGGTQYRLVVRTAPGATSVPGWEPTNLRRLNESEAIELQAWGCGHIAVGLICRAGS